MLQIQMRILRVFGLSKAEMNSIIENAQAEGSPSLRLQERDGEYLVCVQASAPTQAMADEYCEKWVQKLRTRFGDACYGFVTYAEAAKAKLLGVDPTLIEQYNVVSGPVAVAMAYGALQASGADLAVGITGIAGPGGALPGKPVGTVYLAGADARSGKAWLMRLELGGYAERSIIRTRAALYALDLLRRMALDIPPENAHPVPSKDVKPETLDI